jgi:hypothetical protein
MQSREIDREGNDRQRRKTMIRPNQTAMQITLEEMEANHRALRRCRSCGSYERPYEAFNGGVRCERCAKKARRQRQEQESEDINEKFVV